MLRELPGLPPAPGKPGMSLKLSECHPRLGAYSEGFGLLDGKLQHLQVFALKRILQHLVSLGQGCTSGHKQSICYASMAQIAPVPYTSILFCRGGTTWITLKRRVLCTRSTQTQSETSPPQQAGPNRKKPGTGLLERPCCKHMELYRMPCLKQGGSHLEAPFLLPCLSVAK